MLPLSALPLSVLALSVLSRAAGWPDNIVVPALLLNGPPLRQRRHDLADRAATPCQRCCSRSGSCDIIGPTLLFGPGFRVGSDTTATHDKSTSWPAVRVRPGARPLGDEFDRAGFQVVPGADDNQAVVRC